LYRDAGLGAVRGAQPRRHTIRGKKSPPLLAVLSSFTFNRMPTTGERFERAVQIMARLRAPDGCPWDREQNFDTIKPYTLEEAYEVLEAIDNRDWPELTGELGDLLLQVLFYSQMAHEAGHFSVDDVLDRLSNKLVDRHPHVFGDVKADTPAEVLRNWEALKALEKEKKRLAAGGGDTRPSGAADTRPLQSTQRAGHPNPDQSVLAGVSSKMPALMEAYKLSSRAARVGFDWQEIQGLFDKLDEETAELREELKAMPVKRPSENGIAGSGRRQVSPELRERLEDEVGDLFFVLVNIARYLSLDPESALRKTNRKFKCRFQWMEERLRASGRAPQQASMDELESLWQQAKLQENQP
jgi:nucleoside triphosphate diphosphatase